MEAVPMTRFKRNTAGEIRRVELEGVTKRRLLELGITPGTRFVVIRRAPLGDPIEVFIRGYMLAIREEDAGLIYASRVSGTGGGLGL